MSFEIYEYQRVVWAAMFTPPHAVDRWFISTSRRFGKDTLVAQRAVRAKNALIIAANRSIAANMRDRLIDAASCVNQTMTMQDNGIACKAFVGDSTITVCLASGMFAQHASAPLDFVCYLESGIIEENSDMIRSVAMAEGQLADEALVLHITTLPRAGELSNSLFQGELARHPYANCLRVYGKMRGFRTPEEYAEFDKDLSESGYDG